jgi:hypothetical protein
MGSKPLSIDRMRTLGGYVRALLAKWPLASTSIFAAILGIVDTWRKPSNQFILSPDKWLLIAGCSLVLAQYLVWKDLVVSPIPPAHADMLVKIATFAKRAIDNERSCDYSDGLETNSYIRRVFEAHFPKLVRCVDAWNPLLTEVESARRDYYDGANNQIHAQFKVGSGRRPITISPALSQYIELNIRKSSFPRVELTSTEAAVYWNGQIVVDLYDPTGHLIQSADIRTNELEEFVDWATATPQLNVYKQKVDERQIQQAKALDMLYPIIHGDIFRRVRRCPRCVAQQ